MSDERDYLTRQIASLERQRAQAAQQAEQARADALRCEGGLTLARHRLGLLDRQAQAGAEEEVQGIGPAGANGEA